MGVMYQKRRGFTLIETVFTLTLVIILAALSLWSLKPSKNKAPVKGLAGALAEEFESTRQMAIAYGHPVALGIPAQSGRPLASSIYRLKGWNKPVCDWSKGFSGDYLECGFAPAQWSGGGTWDSSGTEGSALSKVGAFRLNDWLPDEFRDDYIFCFTPEGGLVTNQLATLNGRYPVVVGSQLTASRGSAGSATLTAATDPYVIMVGPFGGVEVVTGLPGGSVSPGGNRVTVTSQPSGRTVHGDSSIRISNILVTPRMEGAPPDEGFCVPGQTVTMEVFAYDPEGRALFAKWRQAGKRGIFTYPDGGASSGAVLSEEVDRMEYLDELPNDPRITWTDAPAPAGGVFRARWAWTVPSDTAPGDVYEIEVDVKDAKGECTIANPPPRLTLRPSPKGRIIAEKLINGIWQIVQFNPDGSGERILSPVGVAETMPSLDKAGLKMALLQGTGNQRYVKIRTLDGLTEHTVAGPGEFTSVSLSPDGNWISYRNNGTGRLITSRADGTNSHAFVQSWTTGGTTVKKSRSGWSQDSRFLIWENQNSLRYCPVGQWGLDAEYFHNNHYSSTTGLTIPEQIFAPTTFQPPGGSEHVIFSLGNHNSVLIMLPWNPASPPGYVSCFSAPMILPDMDGGGGSAGSNTIEDDFPSVSWDGSTLILNRSPYSDGQYEDLADQRVSTLHWTGSNFVGPARQLNMQDVRRAVWVP